MLQYVKISYYFNKLSFLNKGGSKGLGEGELEKSSILKPKLDPRDIFPISPHFLQIS